MYGKTSVLGISLGTGGLAGTGFGIAWFVVTAAILLLGGMLLLRSGHRRAASR